MAKYSITLDVWHDFNYRNANDVKERLLELLPPTGVTLIDVKKIKRKKKDSNKLKHY